MTVPLLDPTWDAVPLYDPDWPYVVRDDWEADFAEERERATREQLLRLKAVRAIIKAHEEARQ